MSSRGTEYMSVCQEASRKVPRMGTGAVSILGVPLLVGEGSGVPLLLLIVRSRFDEPGNGLSNRSGVLLCLSCRNQGQGCPIGTSGQPQPPGQHT